ncbi:uncharacterized protein [Physcomitrium patens]|uniref:uncharacterized protein isoform X2 n=1 Tax=Physcomitrium patens TaxID=3218 RepID=UPI000D161438|nr:uncharacterized protein LOC112290475 isoform X2 [Physcomitrium patens]|eukprot:XP_024392515.1 uncharacterized protein LOC112290475 isoform X2 [Physcomitrella patens]
MKKYARLRSTSVTDQSEPCRSPHPDQCTTLSLDDDPPCKWKSNNIASPSGSSKRVDVHCENVDVASSSSSRVHTETLKKLSSLKESSHLDDLNLKPPPRGRNAAQCGPGEVYGPKVESNESLPDNLQRSGSDLNNRCTSFSSVGVGAKRAMGITSISESPCTLAMNNRKFTHRRSASMHDHVGQSARLISAAMKPTAQRPAAKSGLGFLEEGEEAEAAAWSSSYGQPRNTYDNAAPSARRFCASSITSTRLAQNNFSSPLQKSCLWEEVEEDDFSAVRVARASAKVRASGVQSMRYDRLQPEVCMAGELGNSMDEMCSQSVREGVAHAQAIAAMAKAYAEKYGLPQAVVECVSCGRGLGVIVEGNSPGSYDSSFCRSCRPPVLAKSNSKGGKGMMHYCRKILLRMGKKPSHKYTVV